MSRCGQKQRARTRTSMTTGLCAGPACKRKGGWTITRNGKPVAKLCTPHRDEFVANGNRVPDSWKSAEQLAAENQARALAHEQAETSAAARAETTQSQEQPAP